MPVAVVVVIRSNEKVFVLASYKKVPDAVPPSSNVTCFNVHTTGGDRARPTTVPPVTFRNGGWVEVQFAARHLSSKLVPVALTVPPALVSAEPKTNSSSGCPVRFVLFGTVSAANRVGEYAPPQGDTQMKRYVEPVTDEPVVVVILTAE
jgi:hypothetical protein